MGILIMILSKNFMLNEFNPRGLELLSVHTENFKLLAENLQAIRDFLGKPVIVTSGLRSQNINNSLQGSSKTSQHLFGEACDFIVKGLDPSGLDDLFNKIIKLDLVIPNACSQIIRESNGKGAEWIHMGIKTLRWIEAQKKVIACPTANSAQKAKATKRLTHCECMRTPNMIDFELIKYIPYGEFG
jgi:hypothetical protein